MSTKNNTIVENKDFVLRLIDICETDEPAELSRKFDISYQGAKNYLKGRFPEAKVLITIVEKTQCSLNWLLTGEGEKYVNSRKLVNLDETFRAVVREIIREEFERRDAENLTGELQTAEQIAVKNIGKMHDELEETKKKRKAS